MMPETKIALHIAAYNGDASVVFHLLTKGTDVNFPLKRHLFSKSQIKNFHIDLWTPLHCAVDAQKEKVVKILVENGADVNAEDEYGQTPLHLAAGKGNVIIVKLLIQNGANVDSLKILHENMEKSLTGKTKWQIREPLHSAVEARNIAIVKMFLDKNANVNSEDRWNRTPLFLSLLEGDSKILELLLINGANINYSVSPMEKKQKKTALHYLAENLQLKIIKYLSSQLRAKFSEIQMILNLFFYRNFQENYVKSTWDKYEKVIEIVTEYDKMARILLEYGLDVNEKDMSGSSPLFLASKEGNWRIAKTFLENGAEVDLKNEDEKTALHVAILYKRRAIVDLLLEYDADFLISDKDGLTSLNYQCRFLPDFDLDMHVTKIEIYKMTDSEYRTRGMLSDFERQCLEEICNLKFERFSVRKYNFSLFEIFMPKLFERLTRISKNESFCERIYSEDFGEKYQIYGNMLRGRLEKAKWRNGILFSGLEPLNQILNFVFPDLVTEEILSYLSNDDISNLIKVYKAFI